MSFNYFASTRILFKDLIVSKMHFSVLQLQKDRNAPANGNNLIKINIFFDSLNKHCIEDKIDNAFDVWSLFNALGGCLSLAEHLLLQPLRDS